MKKVIIDSEKKTICLTEIEEHIPIFLVRNGEVSGLLTKDDDKWIVRIGGSAGSTGYHNTREEAIMSCQNCLGGDTYFCINPEVK